MTRSFAIVASILTGIAVAIVPNHVYWASYGAEGALGIVSCPTTAMFGTDTCAWLPRLDALTTLTFVAQGVVGAILTFLAFAALRVAWSSFDQPPAD